MGRALEDGLGVLAPGVVRVVREQFRVCHHQLEVVPDVVAQDLVEHVQVVALDFESLRVLRSFGDVAAADEQAVDDLVVQAVLYRRLYPAPGPVCVAELRLDGPGLLGGLTDVRYRLRDHRRGRVRLEVEAVLADEVLGRVAQDLVHRGAHVGDDPVGVDDRHDVLRGFEHRLVALEFPVTLCHSGEVGPRADQPRHRLPLDDRHQPGPPPTRPGGNRERLLVGHRFTRLDTVAVGGGDLGALLGAEERPWRRSPELVSRESGLSSVRFVALAEGERVVVPRVVDVDEEDGLVDSVDHRFVDAAPVSVPCRRGTPAGLVAVPHLLVRGVCRATKYV
nr:hypothetical protein [Halomicroarcula sp. SYNS111]